jgi:hypothetical protein
MSKRIYVLVWTDAEGRPRVEGYWSKPLDEAQQHGYFKEHYPSLYDPGDGTCGITWTLEELKGAGPPVPLPDYLRAGFEPEF